MANPPSQSPAVLVEGARKTFRLPHERRHTLKERALHPFSRPRIDKLDALKDVSFAVQPGEFFGVVGRNGTGKSTLLKCLAGIYKLDAGRMHVGGRVSTFIELGVGFHPELAARDNVLMNGIMLGLSPREARERVDQVIEFAELEKFVDLKLKNYSSGMHVRLAFAVMIQVEADVLLIDEILAVGDAAFQQKCFDNFFRMREKGKTVVFVTHDMAAVERFCHRAMLLDEGQIVSIGDPTEVADRYLRMNFDEPDLAEPTGFGPKRSGAGGARVEEAWMEDDQGKRQKSLPQGRPCTFKALIRFDESIVDPAFEVAFVNAHLQNVFIGTSASHRGGTGRFEAGEVATFSVRFENALAPGRYAISTQLARAGGGHAVLDRWESIFSVVVTAPRAAGGLVDLPHEVQIERSPAATQRSA